MTPDHEAAKMSRASMEREYQQWAACLAKLHADLDAADVPRADAKVCKDPTCDSKIVHRVRAIIAREQHAVRLLQRTLTEIPTSVALHFDIDNFLWERGE